MLSADVMGYGASALVLLTFSMRSMLPLRVIAIGSNAAFIAYAHMMGLYPILFLHVLLLPINVYRLVQLIKRREVIALPLNLNRISQPDNVITKTKQYFD